MSRFSQAISEGDGISLIPSLDGDVAALAALAEEAGAEAIAVASVADVAAAVAAGLPVLVREPVREPATLARLEEAGADAFVLAFDLLGDSGLLEELHEEGLAGDVDCLLDVRDEDELELTLERVDPDIVFISRRNGMSEEEALERTLDLLPDVPAGKLVVAETGPVSRDQILALERAGVDAVLVRDLTRSPDFGSAVRALAGKAQARP
jgi:indole-3-glycerol phosphate synthase